jgi:hypothetical protein
MVLESNGYGLSASCNSPLSRSLNQVTVRLTVWCKRETVMVLFSNGYGVGE